jgi:hypothetical protein
MQQAIDIGKQIVLGDVSPDRRLKMRQPFIGNGITPPACWRGGAVANRPPCGSSAAGFASLS